MDERKKIDKAVGNVVNCIILDNINSASFTSTSGLIKAESSIKKAIEKVYGDE